MARQSAQKIAEGLYEKAVVRRGHSAPQDCSQLLSVVLESGALVAWCVDAPERFAGMQIGDILYINGAPGLADRQRRRILAHEWCHWLRRSTAQSRPIRLYEGRDSAAQRECEERIARAFERLF